MPPGGPHAGIKGNCLCSNDCNNRALQQIFQRGHLIDLRGGVPNAIPRPVTTAVSWPNIDAMARAATAVGNNMICFDVRSARLTAEPACRRTLFEQLAQVLSVFAGSFPRRFERLHGFIAWSDHVAQLLVAGLYGKSTRKVRYRASTAYFRAFSHRERTSETRKKACLRHPT